MVGGTLPQPPHPDLPLFEVSEERLDLRGGPAHRLVRPVVGGDAQARTGRRGVLFLDRRRHHRARRKDRGHGSLARQRPDQLAAHGREPEAVLQREDARRLRRCDLAETVAEDHRRGDTEARPEGGERALQRVDRRLLPHRIVEVGRLGAASEHRVQQGPSPLLPKQPVAAVENRPHHRFARVEVLAHADPLARLSREHERHLRRRFLGETRFVAVRFRGEPGEVVAERRRVPEDHARAPAEVAPARSCGPRHIGKKRLAGLTGVKIPRTPIDPVPVVARELAQRRLRLPGKRQEARPTRRRASLGGWPGSDPLRDGDRNRPGRPNGPRLCRDPAGVAGWRVSPDHDVRVRPRPSESAHPRQWGAIRAARPLRRLRGDPERQPVPVQLRVRGPEVQVLRNHSLPHGKQGLDETRRSGRRFQVPDVGLHRTDEQGAVRPSALAVGRGGGAQFDGIADFRAGSVRFQVVHRRGRNFRPGERVLDDPFLRLLVRHGQSRARPVLVDRRSLDHAPDPVAVGLRIAKPLQDQDAAALTAYVPVGAGVERLALAVGREHSGAPAEFGEPARQDRVHPAGEREIRFAPLKAGDRLVGRDQRRRAGGVERHGGSGQAEREGDPSDRGVEGGAGDRIEARRRLRGVLRLQDQAAIVVVADSGVDAGAAASQLLRVNPRVLEGLPAHFEHQALLRVQELRLDRRDPEERGVEAVEPLEVGPETAGFGLDRGVREEFAYPADARTGNSLDHGVPARLEEAPERRDVRGAGEPARHADDGDRLPRG